MSTASCQYYPPLLPDLPEAGVDDDPEDGRLFCVVTRTSGRVVRAVPCTVHTPRSSPEQGSEHGRAKLGGVFSRVSGPPTISQSPPVTKEGNRNEQLMYFPSLLPGMSALLINKKIKTMQPTSGRFTSSLVARLVVQPVRFETPSGVCHPLLRLSPLKMSYVTLWSVVAQETRVVEQYSTRALAWLAYDTCPSAANKTQPCDTDSQRNLNHQLDSGSHITALPYLLTRVCELMIGDIIVPPYIKARLVNLVSKCVPQEERLLVQLEGVTLDSSSDDVSSVNSPVLAGYYRRDLSMDSGIQGSSCDLEDQNALEDDGVTRGYHDLTNKSRSCSFFLGSLVEDGPWVEGSEVTSKWTGLWTLDGGWGSAEGSEQTVRVVHSSQVGLESPATGDVGKKTTPVNACETYNLVEEVYVVEKLQDEDDIPPRSGDVAVFLTEPVYAVPDRKGRDREVLQRNLMDPGVNLRPFEPANHETYDEFAFIHGLKRCLEGGDCGRDELEGREDGRYTSPMGQGLFCNPWLDLMKAKDMYLSHDSLEEAQDLQSVSDHYYSSTTSRETVVDASKQQVHTISPVQFHTAQVHPATPSPVRMDVSERTPEPIVADVVTQGMVEEDCELLLRTPPPQHQLVVVAIDIGTTYSGYAFSFTRDPEQNIHMMRKWEGGDPGLNNQKTPTTLLLTPEGHFHSFGCAARDYFNDLDSCEARHWYFLDKFKMTLHHRQVDNREGFVLIGFTDRWITGGYVLIGFTDSSGLCQQGYSDRSGTFVGSSVVNYASRRVVVKSYRNSDSVRSWLRVGKTMVAMATADWTESHMSASLRDRANATSSTSSRPVRIALQDVNRMTGVRAANGEILPVLTVFAHALRHLKNQVLRELSDQAGSRVDPREVRWVVTVPAMWRQPAKQLVREAAYQQILSRRVDKAETISISPLMRLESCDWARAHHVTTLLLCEYTAGLCDSYSPESLLIALEPEVASICCRKLRLNQLIPERPPEQDWRVIRTSSSTFGLPFDEPVGNEMVLEHICEGASSLYNQGHWGLGPLDEPLLFWWLTPGTRYMVVDCGGGTVDITVHELSEHLGTLRELHKATGGPCGSMAPQGSKLGSLALLGVDHEFETLLQKMFGEDFILQFRLRHPAAYVELILSFEARKRSASPHRNSSYNIFPPFAFIDYFRKSQNKEVGEAVREFGRDDVTWSSQGMLRLQPCLMLSLFRPTVDKILKHISDVLNSPRVEGIQYLFLVGGFAESQVLQHEVRKAFNEKAKVIIPQGVSLTILRGAVQFGLDPSVVQVRRSKQTYGVGVLKRFVHGVHPTEKMVTKDDVEWCSDVLDKFVTVNQPIRIGENVTRRYTPALASQMSIVINIYCADSAEVEFTTDPGVRQCGTLKLDLPYQLSDGASVRREIQTRMVFGGTEVKASALDISSGLCVNVELDFLAEH
uniref:Uncharacterized protein n=1 Tax=Timema monikensis TaxID=170555 RepID=A0A7R9HNE4_9NEOP|nr:unnamed protein product [Timema monikensis]